MKIKRVKIVKLDDYTYTVKLPQASQLLEFHCIGENSYTEMEFEIVVLCDTSPLRLFIYKIFPTGATINRNNFTYDLVYKKSTNNYHLFEDRSGLENCLDYNPVAEQDIP